MLHRNAILVVLLLALAAPAFGVPLDAPGVSLVTADRTSVTLRVQAGPSGAPGGFIVEWLPADQYLSLGGWPVSPASGSNFTGAPTLHVTPGLASFQLGAGQVAEVVIGKLFDETGLESSDRTELEHGTDYVVRARAAAGQGFSESANSATIDCQTLPRTATDCTVSQGYWKSHPEGWSRVTSLALGSVTYTQAQILAILQEPARGNGLVSLAHQLIATKLNMLLGALPTDPVAVAVGQADLLIGAQIVPPVGSGWIAPAGPSLPTSILDDFNTGQLGPGHCPGDLQVLPTVNATWGTLKSIYR